MPLGALKAVYDRDADRFRFLADEMNASGVYRTSQGFRIVRYRAATPLFEVFDGGQGDLGAVGQVLADSSPAAAEGAYFGAADCPENKKEDRKDHRLKGEQQGKKQSLVVARAAPKSADVATSAASI